MKPAPLAKFAQSQTRRRLEQVVEAVRRAAKHPEEAESAHDLRVAIRRFLQCAEMFEGLFKTRSLEKVRKPLQKLMSLSGAKRDYDVGLQVLEEAGIPPQSSIAMKFRENRDAEMKTLVRYLSRKKTRRDADSWQDRMHAVGDPSGDWKWAEGVRENAQRMLPPWVGKFMGEGDAAMEARGNHEVLHQFRLETKRLRYALEVFSAVYGPDLKPKLMALRKLQDRLGAINDCVVVLAMPQVEGTAARAVNRLLVKREGAFRHYWKETFPPEVHARWTRAMTHPRARRGARGTRTDAKLKTPKAQVRSM